MHYIQQRCSASNNKRLKGMAPQKELDADVMYLRTEIGKMFTGIVDFTKDIKDGEVWFDKPDGKKFWDLVGETCEHIRYYNDIIIISEGLSTDAILRLKC